MIVPLLLMILAVLMALATLLPGAGAWADLRLLAALIGVGALILWLRAWRRPRAPPVIVVDGSNVLHWDGNVPRLETLSAVLDALERQGFAPVVWFDANVGYLVGGRHAGAEVMATRLGLPPERVHVMPRGSPADPALIADATRRGASIVSNDRFRDWQGDALQDRLVRGSVRDGAVRLHLPQGR